MYRDTNIKVSLFGTCRLSCIRQHFDCTDFDDAISYVHSTKEIVQLIKYITGQIEIPDDINRFCFRTAILNKQPVAYSDRFREQFEQTDIFVMEICSIKKYIYQGYYLHHLAVDTRLKFCSETPEKVIRETKVVRQDRSEVEEDIDEILSLIHPKKVLFVSHINAVVNNRKQGRISRACSAAVENMQRWFTPNRTYSPAGHTIASRAELIELLGEAAGKRGVPFFDPTVVFNRYRQDKVLQREEPGLPPGHYTDFGNKVMGRLYAQQIRKIMA